MTRILLLKRRLRFKVFICHGEPCRTMTQGMSSFDRAQDDMLEYCYEHLPRHRRL